jgi:hypothetical protein
MEFSWLRPGVVYGSYRYRVSFGGNESTGRSERVLMETDAGWRIAVSTAFPDPPGTPPPPLALVGGTLISGPDADAVPNATLVVRDGKIVCAGPGCEIPGDAERIVVLNLWAVMGEVLNDPFGGEAAADGAGFGGEATAGGAGAADVPPADSPWKLTAKFGLPTEGDPANLLIIAKDPRQAGVSSPPSFHDLRMVIRGGEMRNAEEYRGKSGGHE